MVMAASRVAWEDRGVLRQWQEAYLGESALGEDAGEQS